MELKKFEPMMPMMPEVMQRAMPVVVPQLEYNTSFLKGFFHNWKLNQLERASAREANIASNKTALVQKNLESIEALTTFSARLQNTFIRFETERQMLALYKDLTAAELDEKRMKNYLLQMEVENAQLDLKLKKKGVGEDED